MRSGSGWTSVRVTPSEAAGARERCLGALFHAGAQGVHEDGSALVTHFPPASDLAAIRRVLAAADPAGSTETAPVPDVDWSQAWKSSITAHDLGELSIVPPWLADGRDPARTVIIEPGMAFGTGEHPTTRGVVRLMPSVVRVGNDVADLGSGSAVLSIAAAKLGAARVYAIELDGEAMPDAEGNVRRNGVADRVHLFEGEALVLLPLLAPVHVILANIISSVLVELLPVMHSSLTPDGAAIISGILHDERENMLEVLESTGWRLMLEDHEDPWWSASIAPA